jgi:hypothetical protein
LICFFLFSTLNRHILNSPHQGLIGGYLFIKVFVSKICVVKKIIYSIDVTHSNIYGHETYTSSIDLLLSYIFSKKEKSFTWATFAVIINLIWLALFINYNFTTFSIFIFNNGNDGVYSKYSETFLFFLFIHFKKKNNILKVQM